MKTASVLLLVGAALLSGCIDGEGPTEPGPLPASEPAHGSKLFTAFTARYDLEPRGSMDVELGPPVSIKDQGLHARPAYPLTVKATIPQGTDTLPVHFVYYLDGDARIARVDQRCSQAECDRWTLNWRAQGNPPPLGFLWDVPGLNYTLAGAPLQTHEIPWQDGWVVQLPSLKAPESFLDFEGRLQWDGKAAPTAFEGAASLFASREILLSGQRTSFEPGERLDEIPAWPIRRHDAAPQELHPRLYQGSRIDHFHRGVTADHAFTHLTENTPETFDYLDDGCVLRVSITPHNLSRANLQGTQLLPDVQNQTQTYFRFTLGNHTTSRTWEVIYAQDNLNDGTFGVYNVTESVHTFDCSWQGLQGPEMPLDSFREEVERTGIEIPHGVLSIRYARFHDDVDLNLELGGGQYMFAYLNESIDEPGNTVLFPYTLKMRAASGAWEAMKIPPDQARALDAA